MLLGSKSEFSYPNHKQIHGYPIVHIAGYLNGQRREATYIGHGHRCLDLRAGIPTEEMQSFPLSAVTARFRL